MWLHEHPINAHRMRAGLPPISTLWLCLLPLVPLTTAAQDAYPSRPVRFIVPSAAGGGTDIVTRAIAQ